MGKKNGFVMFMEDRRASVVKSGVVLTGGFAQLAELLSEDWRNLPQDEKDRYNQRAKRFNDQVAGNTQSPPQQRPRHAAIAPVEPLEPSGPGHKSAMTKAYLSELKKANRKYVLDLFETEWPSHPIVVCNFTTYFGPKYDDIYFPAEVGLATFTLTDGVIDNFGRVIAPGDPPLGYASETATYIEKLGIPHPGFESDFADLDSLMETMIQYLEKYRGNFPGNENFVFALDHDFDLVTCCFEWLNRNTGHSCPTRVLNLGLFGYLASTNGDLHDEDGEEPDENPESLFATISEYRVAAKPLNDCFTFSPRFPMTRYGLFMTEKEVSEMMEETDNYKYYDELCCVYHFKTGIGGPHCPLNVSNRQAYYLLEVLTMGNEVEILRGAHYPEVYEQQKEIDRRRAWLSNWGITALETGLEEPPLLEVQIAQVKPFRQSRPRDREDGPRRMRNPETDSSEASRGSPPEPVGRDERRSQSLGGDAQARGPLPQGLQDYTYLTEADAAALFPRRKIEDGPAFWGGTPPVPPRPTGSQPLTPLGMNNPYKGLPPSVFVNAPAPATSTAPLPESVRAPAVSRPVRAAPTSGRLPAAAAVPDPLPGIEEEDAAVDLISFD